VSSNDVKKMGEFMKKLNPTINEDFTDNIISAFLRALNPGVGNVVDNIIKSGKQVRFNVSIQDKNVYESILSGIGVPVNDNNLAVLLAWRQLEGGGGRNNPFNSTFENQNDQSMTSYNSEGVKNYSTTQYGIESTIKTLKTEKYSEIVSNLSSGDVWKTCDSDIFESWGYNILMKQLIASYIEGATPQIKSLS
jgi:hypothetical protein